MMDTGGGRHHVRRDGGANLQSLVRPTVSRTGSRSSFNGDSHSLGAVGGRLADPPEIRGTRDRDRDRGRERSTHSRPSTREHSRERPGEEGRPQSRRGSFDHVMTRGVRSRSASRSRGTSPGPHPPSGLTPYRPPEGRGGSHYSSGASAYSAYSGSVMFSTHMSAKPPTHSSPKAQASSSSSSSSSFERPRYDRQASVPLRSEGSRSPTNRRTRSTRNSCFLFVL